MFLLKTHSDFSLLQGLPQAQDIVKHTKKLGYEGCALTDYGNICGAIQFAQCGKEEKFKTLNGCQFSIKNGGLNHITIIAKNLEGWNNLVKATSYSHLPENLIEDVPTIKLNKLAEYQGWLAYSGYLGSELFNQLFEKSAVNLSYDEAKATVNKDWERITVNKIHEYQDLFGKENFYTAIQLNNILACPASDIVAKILRYVCDKYKLPKIFVHDSHYLEKADSADHRVLLCTEVKGSTLQTVEKLLEESNSDTIKFFKSNNYHVPTLEEVKQYYTQDEIENTSELASKCETYNVFSQPRMPKFDTDNPDELLRDKCREGWRQKIKDVIPKDQHQVYVDRIKNELAVIQKANLSTYFLIVQDFCSWFKSHEDWIMGKSRGSAGGCLISYLTNITEIDPIKYGLIFERFYNEGRNTKDKIKLPDIDCDFPRTKREFVVNYIKNKYGHDKVAHMSTYQRMQGRGAIKDVLRVHNRCSFKEMNDITQFIPDESKIADKLQEMKDEFGESSIIRWALENNKKDLQEWAYFNDKGMCEGPLALYFEQAIRLEGTRRNRGKHASGIIIAPEPLLDSCPMAYDSHSKEMYVALEMEDAEYCGHLKFDILGIKTLDKMMAVESIVRKGYVS